MRPLLIANYGYVVGGGEVGLQMLLEDLTGAGHQPMVAVPGESHLFAGFDRRPIALDLPNATLNLRDLAREADLIHCFSIRSALMAVLADSGKPLILHALVPKRDPYDPVLSQFADLILCNSWATARRFEAPANPRVVYNGVRNPTRPAAPLPLRPGRRTIGLLGNTCPRKGQLDVMPALDQVLAARHDVDVAFVGRVGGSVGLALKDRADSSRGRIRLLGFFPNAADHLEEFSLILVPSRSEGFGRVAVEAMRAGVPVLATRVEGLTEALQDLQDPWLPDQREHWAARIIRELDDPAHSPDDLKRAAERFAPECYIATILGWYDHLLQRPAQRTPDAALLNN